MPEGFEQNSPDYQKGLGVSDRLFFQEGTNYPDEFLMHVQKDNPELYKEFLQVLTRDGNDPERLSILGEMDGLLSDYKEHKAAQEKMGTLSPENVRLASEWEAQYEALGMSDMDLATMLDYLKGHALGSKFDTRTFRKMTGNRFTPFITVEAPEDADYARVILSYFQGRPTKEKLLHFYVEQLSKPEVQSPLRPLEKPPILSKFAPFILAKGRLYVVLQKDTGSNGQ